MDIPVGSGFGGVWESPWSWALCCQVHLHLVGSPKTNWSQVRGQAKCDSRTTMEQHKMNGVTLPGKEKQDTHLEPGLVCGAHRWVPSSWALAAGFDLAPWPSHLPNPSRRLTIHGEKILGWCCVSWALGEDGGVRMQIPGIANLLLGHGTSFCWQGKSLSWCVRWSGTN